MPLRKRVPEPVLRNVPWRNTATSRDEEISILWTKNADGTYALINGDAKATVKLDTVKGQFTTDSGSVFLKEASDASGLTPIIGIIYHRSMS